MSYQWISSSPTPVQLTSHLRRPYGPLAGARKVDFRKHIGCMLATNQETQLKDCAEGLMFDVVWEGSRMKSPPYTVYIDD